MKKILVVDDSALVRRVLCDIINADERFQVEDTAPDGDVAFELLSRKKYDAVVLDVNMPKLNGLELLKELRDHRISAKVMMASTDTKEGAKTTLDALDLGALDFIEKPSYVMDCRKESFSKEFLRILEAVAESEMKAFDKPFSIDNIRKTREIVDFAKKHQSVAGRKIVAIASSTGGPKALQSVITRLPANLDAPVLIVQHMPEGFTKSLAERLDSISEIAVSEAVDGEKVLPGHVYIAMGGKHMNVDMKLSGEYVIRYSDEPSREGVKPCANYMYESLLGSAFDEIICVVMTGMGADGTKGIANLKNKKKVHVIAQEESTCAVYGMPKNVVQAGMADQIVPLEHIAHEIILYAGVK